MQFCHRQWVHDLLKTMICSFWRSVFIWRNKTQFTRTCLTQIWEFTPPKSSDAHDATMTALRRVSCRNLTAVFQQNITPSETNDNSEHAWEFEYWIVYSYRVGKVIFGAFIDKKRRPSKCETLVTQCDVAADAAIFASGVKKPAAFHFARPCWRFHRLIGHYFQIHTLKFSI